MPEQQAQVREVINARHWYEEQPTHESQVKAVHQVARMVDVDPEGVPAAFEQGEVGCDDNDRGDEVVVVGSQGLQIGGARAEVSKGGEGGYQVGASEEVEAEVELG
jgi:uncharacterized Zn-binding protein involved in type VI secretion